MSNTTRKRSPALLKKLKLALKLALRVKPELKEQLIAINRLFNKSIIKRIDTSESLIKGFLTKHKGTQKATFKKLNKYLQLEQQEQQEQEEQNINNTLYFINLDNTGNTTGAFEKLNKILDTKTEEQNIILKIYGTDEESRTRNTGDSITTYKPDPTFKNLYKIINLSEEANHQTKAGYKGALYSTVAGLRHYGTTEATGQFIIADTPTPEQYHHKFKYGYINCLLSSITEQLNKGQRIRKNIELLEQKIKKLNDIYFYIGVSIIDIPYIENILNISIDIFNKAKQQIYKSTSNNKGQKITLKTPYINHISEYADEIADIKDKNKILIDDIENHYNANTSKYKYYKTNQDNKKIFYYDEINIYYEPFVKNDEIINKDDIYIYDELTLQQNNFIKENELMNNIISSEDDPQLFEFLNNSIHHLNKYTNKELIKTFNFPNTYTEIKNNTKPIMKEKDIKNTKSLLDANIEDDEQEEQEQQEQPKTDIINFQTIDNNKCFIGYTNPDTPAGQIYKRLGVPNNKFNFYKTQEQPAPEFVNKILNNKYISFLHIKPIFKNETVKAVIVSKLETEINLDEFIFTSFFIKYLIDNEIIENNFIIKAIATATGKQNLFFNEDIINNKYYNEIIGTMSCKNEYKNIKFEVSTEAEIKDILFYKNLENKKDIQLFINENTITIKTKKQNISNRGHISGVLLSYSLINIIDVLKDVKLNNLLQITADAITTLYPITATISTKAGEWKHQDKNIINIQEYNHYINIKNINYTNYKELLILTEEKQKYKKYNFISGEAGTGKTTQYIKPFKTDERLYNSLFLVPSNCLLNELSKDNKINIDTYQGFIMSFYQNEDKHRANKKQFIKYSNIILDETTMINSEEMKQIFNIVNDNNFNIFIIGDYDLKNKKAYQLRPVKGDEWFKKELDKEIIRDSYFKHLTINHRQNGDKDFYNLLQNIRGKTNEQIKNIIMTDSTIKKIKYDILIKEYDINDKILSSVNNFIDKINKDIKPKEDVKILYTTTTTKHAKNQTAIIKASDYDPKKHKLGYAQTAHTAQGLTFNNNIFININNLFTDNILYVMLSRAKRKEQIYIIE